ncbi:unnamed protein product [Cunninghamella blakesleeana]
MSNNTYEVLGDGSSEGDIIDVDYFKFSSLVPDAKVSIQDTTFNKNDYPSYVSLLACSKIYGYFVAGHTQGFVFGQTEQLRKAFYDAEKGSTVTLDNKIIIPTTDGLVHHLQLSSDEKTIIVGLSNKSILTYLVSDILEKRENILPTNIINTEASIIDLRPNPEAIPESACLLLKGNKCNIINWKTGNIMAEIPGADFSSICWSPKGKQVACGRLQGSLEFYDIKGDKKDTIIAPESMRAGYGDEKTDRNVQAVLWIENHQFLVLYARPAEPDSNEYINDGFIIDRKPKSGDGHNYTLVPEITPIFSPEGRSNHFYIDIIRHFGKNIPHLIILANGATNEISVVGEDADGKWATWYLPENGMASLPLSEETNFDTFPLGLSIDFSATEKLPPYDASEDETGVEPFPILLYINDEGHICSHHCYNEEIAKAGGKYEGMATPISINDNVPSTTKTTTALPSSAMESSVTSTPEITKSAFATSPFGVALQSSSSGASFASLTKIQGASNPTSNFGLLAKQTVTNSITPTFGSATSFGSMSSPSFGSTGFGASTTPTASLASFGKPMPAVTTTSAFGSTPNNDSTSSFEIIKDDNDSPTKDNSEDKKENVFSFGSLSIDKNNENKSEVIVKNAATATTTTDKKEDTLFCIPSKEEDTRATSSPGLGGFGSLAKVNNVPAFGTSTTTNFSGFGSLAKKDSVPTFGSTASFGSSIKKDGDGTMGKPAFGTTTGFGALAKKDNVPTFGAATSFGSMTKKDNIPTFGTTTNFGAIDATNITKKDETPVFGTTATAADEAKKSNSPAFGGFNTTTVKSATTPAFGGFGATSTIKKDGPSPSFGTTTGFGALTKNKVPGAIDSQSGYPSNAQTNKEVPTIVATTPSKPVLTESIKENTPEKELVKETINRDPKEGMAKEFELIYFKIAEELEKLSTLHVEFAEKLKSQDKQLNSMSKSVKNLTSNLEQWRLGDSKELEAVTQTVFNLLEKCDTTVQKEALNSLELKTAQLLSKKELIQECLDEKKSDSVKVVLKEVRLDESAREEVESLQKTCNRHNDTLQELESRVHDKNKLQQRVAGREIKSYNNLSFYSLNCAIRNVEKDLKTKDNEIKDLERKLALLRFEENQKRAKFSPSKIAFEGLSDDEEDEEETDVSALVSHGIFQSDHIDYTVKQIEQENFLETLCDHSNNNIPLTVNIEVSVEVNNQ